MTRRTDGDRHEADPREVARDIRDCQTHVDTIIDRLCATSTDSELDRITSDGVRGRGDPRGSDPTLGELEHLERWLTVRERRLVGRFLHGNDEDGTRVVTGEENGIVHDLTVLAGACHVDLEEPVTDDELTLEQLIAAIRDTAPTSRTWRLRLRQLGTALHGLLTGIHDGWQDIYRGRWTVGDDGISRWDEGTNRHALFLAGWIRQVSGRRVEGEDPPPGDNLRRLAGAVTPPKPASQPDLVHCRNHPDRLARNRRQRLCDACRKREERAGKTTAYTTVSKVLKPGDTWT